MLDKYLPKRYQAAKAHVVDSLGNFSQQIDVVVFDRQYSPFIFTYRERDDNSCRKRLRRLRGQADSDGAHGRICAAEGRERSASAPHQPTHPLREGRLSAKPLIPILGGLLTFESEWSPALGPVI